MHAALAELQDNYGLITRLAAALGQPRPAKRGRRPGAKRDCAIIDCGEPARTKGYCNNHYQKFNLLKRTRRLPRDWVADAAPGTVKNIALPRGRAGTKGKRK